MREITDRTFASEHDAGRYLLTWSHVTRIFTVTRTATGEVLGSYSSKAEGQRHIGDLQKKDRKTLRATLKRCHSSAVKNESFTMRPGDIEWKTAPESS